MVRSTVRFVRKKMGVSDWFAPVLLFAVLGVIVLGPALRYGYVFLLDMPWPQKFQLSDFTASGSAHVPISVLLTLANKVLPAWVLQKIVLVSILTLAGFSMYRLHRHFKVPRSRRYAAGIVYACNPFVLERLAGGQWLLLLGYAMLPFFVSRLVLFARNPNRKNTIRLAILYGIYPIISVHWWYIITLCIIPLAFKWLHSMIRKKSTNKIRVMSYVAALALLVGLLNFRWLLSLLKGTSKLSDISVADFRLFATAGDGLFGSIGAVVSLYGFWQQHYAMPAVEGLMSLMLPLIFLLLSAAGAWYLYKKFGKIAAYPFALLPIIIILASGFGSPLTLPFTSVMIRLVPGYMGLRDTGKLVGVIAAIYAFYLPYGLAVLQRELKKAWSILSNRRLIAGGFLLVYGVMMLGGFWGLNGQLKAYPYPKGWAEAETFLQVQGAQKIVVMPWRGYITLDFAHDTFAANPAQLYFSPHVIQSTSVNNVSLDAATPDSEYDYLAREILYGNTATALLAYKQKGIDYLVLLKTSDWQNYSLRLDTIDAAYEDKDIALYKL